MAALRTEVLNFLNPTAAGNQYKMNELHILSIKDICKLADMVFWKRYRCNCINNCISFSLITYMKKEYYLLRRQSTKKKPKPQQKHTHTQKKHHRYIPKILVCTQIKFLLKLTQIKTGIG